jgi:serine protease Do
LGYPVLDFPSGLLDTNRTATVRTGVVLDTADMTGIFETSCQFSGGFSGGGVFDLEGRVVGIHQGGDNESGPARHGRVELLRTQWDSLAVGKAWDVVATNAPNPATEGLEKLLQGRPWKN